MAAWWVVGSADSMAGLSAGPRADLKVEATAGPRAGPRAATKVVNLVAMSVASMAGPTDD